MEHQTYFYTSPSAFFLCNSENNSERYRGGQAVSDFAVSETLDFTGILSLVYGAAIDERKPLVNVRPVTQNKSSVVRANQNNVPITLSQIYEKSAIGAEAEALMLLYDATEGAFAKKNLPFVNALLAQFDPKRVKRMVAVGIVRGTFRAREELGAWQPCLERVAANLNENGYSAEKLLRGLYSPK